MLIDTHAHLDDEKFKDDLIEVINRATENGISNIITVSSAPGSIKNTLNIIGRFPNIFGAAGLHPHDAKHFNDKTEEDIICAIKNEKIIAVGEIGLDFHYNHSSKADQLNALRRQIKIAKDNALPIIVHDRESTNELFEVFGEFRSEMSGVIHCFTGDSETAKRYIELGFHISFSGIVTFPKADKIREAAKIVPLDRILIETDAPYLAAVPMRGKRNEPSFVKHTCEALANNLGIKFEELANQTTENAKRLFKIKP